MIRFIGDTHGKWNVYRKLRDESPFPTIQIGDFGWGFGDEPVDLQHTTDNTHRWIRGNHDNPSECVLNPNYIPDGTVEGSVMFIGGAYSIDRLWRTSGINWWSDEELSYAEFQRMFDIYEDTKPEVMVTHDFPDTVARKLFHFYSPMEKNPSITRQCFDAFLGIHKPKLWIAGHWHEPRDEEIDGVRYVCIDQYTYKDFEV